MNNHAIVVLDETGSMAGQETRVVTSMNEYAKTCAKSGASLTVFCFDSERWRTFFDGPASDWKQMESGDYRPGAMTPLYDAIARGIKHAEGKAADGDKVMMMVDTDGLENASKEHTQGSIKALVEAKKEAGWEFLFMASGIDVRAAEKVALVGALVGMPTSKSDYAGRAASYRAASHTTAEYFSGKTSGKKSTSDSTPFWPH